MIKNNILYAFTAGQDLVAVDLDTNSLKWSKYFGSSANINPALAIASELIVPYAYSNLLYLAKLNLDVGSLNATY